MATLKTLVPILKILSNIPSIMKMFYYYYFEQDCLSTQNFRNDFFFQILLLFLCKTFGHSIRIIWKHFNRFAMQIGSPAFVRIGHCDLFIYLFIYCFIYLFIYYHLCFLVVVVLLIIFFNHFIVVVLVDVVAALLHCRVSLLCCWSRCCCFTFKCRYFIVHLLLLHYN